MWIDSLSVVAENPNAACREDVGTPGCVLGLLGYCHFLSLGSQSWPWVAPSLTCLLRQLAARFGDESFCSFL